MGRGLTDMRVLIVDDNATNIDVIEQIFEHMGYKQVLATQDPQGVAHLCRAWNPDVVLLDLHMPHMSGFEVMAGIRELMSEPENLPVLVVTADGATEARHRALSMGARDFITKPIDQAEFRLRVRNALQVRHLQHELMRHNASLDHAVRVRTLELEQARMESLTMLASVGEYHDDDTHHHTQRVGRSAAMIAEVLGLPGTTVETIRHAAPLHDIGKVGIPYAILLKPGALTAEERDSMQRHVEIGAKVLSSARSPVLQMAAVIARTHHERWDGSGYLEGLGGEEIPLAGRITAVADVFDALTHERPYKHRWPVDDAVSEILTQAGRQFDPRVVEAFSLLDPYLLADPELATEPVALAA